MSFNVRLRLQRGFSLLEVLVAVSLTIGVVLATSTAVANSLHNSAVADLHMALNDDALSALADVRAVSAYDKAMLAKLSGRTATMTRIEGNGGIETIAVSLAPADPTVPADSVASGHLIATATASQGNVAVTQTQTLSWEAPAPGSSVNQP